MYRILNWLPTVNLEMWIEIIIAIAIIILFRMFSSTIAYIIIKMFKIKDNKKDIKKSAFYEPLKSFFKFLGLYIAILFLSEPFNFSETTIYYVNKIFRIIIILTTSKGLADSFTIQSRIVNKIMSEKEIDENTIKIIYKIIRFVIYIIAGFLIISELGYNLGGLVTGLGIGSVVITLAAQDIAKSVFGGLVLFADKPFKIGDYIQVNSYEGTVEDMTFRATKIRTAENSILNIPNSELTSAAIINCSQMQKRRYKTTLVAELDTPLEKLESTKMKIYDMLKNAEHVISESIIVRFDNISDNGMDILVSTYVDIVNYMEFLKLKEELNYKIMNILAEERVELAYDTKTINLKK